ncbi:MAG: RNA polymerase sigma factor FliA [Pseudomonadota bacterium]|nr:RNA polymerase sigma factor FliA [Pseudomonadota bacterium]
MASIDAYKRQLLDSNSSTSSQYSLVKRVAYHLSSRLPSNIAIEDLVQAGMEGLLQAQKVFDASRGVNFELFAKTRIRGAMLDEVRRISFSTRNVISTKRRQDDIVRDLTQKLGRQPKNIEVASELGISIEEYESDRLLAGSAEFVSTDESPEAFEEIDENRGGPEAELEQAEDIEALASAIEKLPERSQQILALYYQEEMNLKEIGEILSVSESRISQIISETAGKLRKLMSS